MVPGERERLIKFLAQSGIYAVHLPDAELRQRAQRIESEQKLNGSGLAVGKKKSKKNKLATKKIPGK